MAAKTKHRHHSRALVRVPTVKPIVIRTSAAPVHHKKHHRKGGRGAFGGMVTSQEVKLAIGGAALGFIKKTFPNIPTIPVLGQNGTIALAAKFLKGKVPFAEEAGLAALVVSAYQFAETGKVEGGDYVVGGF
jgi:hypothetical protein